MLTRALFALLLLTCQAWAQAAAVPDSAKTPGAVRSDLTLDQIRTTKWGRDRRHVTAAMRKEVLRRYGIASEHDPSCGIPRCELDHSIPRCLGGAVDVNNLYPQSAPWWRLKDQLEDYACRAVDRGTMTLDAARALFARDWRVSYAAVFGHPPEPAPRVASKPQ